MQWFNDFSDWLFSTSARPAVFTAVVLMVAIVLSGLLAAWVARGSVRRLIDQRDREIKATAIAALIDAATEASVWNSLTPQEQVLADRAVGEADIRVRMLPIRGAAVAADWAAHQLHEMKRASATFGYELEPAVAEFRDRLLDWQNRPARARKLFQNDLERWKAMNTTAEKQMLAEQDAWVAEQHRQHFTEPKIESAAYSAPRVDSQPSPETQRLLDDVSGLPNRRVSDETAPTGV
ncbi:hypothetical protein WDJ51_07245 [Rathayibacter sp. YIM 133350]|uniref:hypothetical protein n=1 Tax=Rathayibacter sp. YIM 133350 TaxID=3131992 RepID=UPI00307F7601